MESENMKENREKIRYSTVLVLFVLGSLLGVLIEGLWYLVDHGGWETHVVTIWGPFCIIYGFGMAGCYMVSKLMKDKKWWQRFLTFSVLGALVEFLGGWLILKVYRMRAWDYSGKFLDIMGLTDFNMSIVWGFIGTAFGFLVPYIDKIMSYLRGRWWQIAVYCFSIFMAVDLLWTATVLGRWSNRHFGLEPQNVLSRRIDELYSDEYLEDRYIEWWFTDEPGPRSDQ